jgi:hypothetical protein
MEDDNQALCSIPAWHFYISPYNLKGNVLIGKGINRGNDLLSN